MASTLPTPMETMANERLCRPFDLEAMTNALGGGAADVALKRRFMNVSLLPLLSFLRRIIEAIDRCCGVRPASCFFRTDAPGYLEHDGLVVAAFSFQPFL